MDPCYISSSVQGKCKLYRFWELDNEEFNQAEYIESISQRFGGGDDFHQLEKEITVLNARLMKLEMVWLGATLRKLTYEDA
ncbi:hypothetical protein Ddye_032346 [Dipteronia dyeriana]|uniref:Uncharacterized protein n=1 Tax=Dipteronia dyeriana TaxID=168575 RepID=A0AAD9TK15_9ROSI|nr:hypothetical protein Ddye_032346 [Dipteronia dyeriana]